MPGSAGQQDGRGTEARFSSPWGITVDQTRSKLVVVDYGNHRIRVVNLADGAVSSLGGGSISGYKDGRAASAMFSFPAMDLHRLLSFQMFQAFRIAPLLGPFH